jgi:ferredoxin
MQVLIDRSRCTGHAQCAVQAPDLFVLDDDGYIALAPVVDVPAGLEDGAQAGAANCPERVITCIGS